MVDRPTCDAYNSKKFIDPTAMMETVGSAGPHSDPGRVQARRKYAEGRISLLSCKPNEEDPSSRLCRIPPLQGARMLVRR